MGKRRGPDIFDDSPLTEDFLEWMVSPDGQTAGEVSALCSPRWKTPVSMPSGADHLG